MNQSQKPIRSGKIGSNRIQSNIAIDYNKWLFAFVLRHFLLK